MLGVPGGECYGPPVDRGDIVVIALGLFHQLCDQYVPPCREPPHGFGSRPVVLEAGERRGTAVAEKHVGHEHMPARTDVLPQHAHRLGRGAEDVPQRGEDRDVGRHHAWHRPDVAVSELAQMRDTRGLRGRSRLGDKRLEQLDAQDVERVTIDDNEAHYLKVVGDEMFGRTNIVANLAWHKRVSPANDAK